MSRTFPFLAICLAGIAGASGCKGDDLVLLPPGCDQTDPGGQSCDTPEDCGLVCYCSDGSTVAASSCEGQCGSADTLCPTFCSAAGWEGDFCANPL